MDGQVALCQQEAARRDWTVAGVLTDVAKSAYEAQYRPAYQQLLTEIQAGNVDAVLIRHNDRLHRDIGEYKTFEKLIRKHKVQVVAVHGGEWFVETASGRLAGSMLAAVGAFESDVKAERVNDALRRRAEAGLPANTRQRPFGFEADGITVRESEAEMVRSAVAGLLAGTRTLGSVAREWGRTVTGTRKILQSPRLVGLRTFQGATYTAVWPAIVDRDQWDLLQLLLAGRTTEPRQRRHLLSGVAVCGTCEHKLKVLANRGRPYYRCVNPGCSHKIARAADKLESHVEIRLLNQLERTAQSPLEARRNEEALQTVRRLETRLAELETAMGEDDAPVAVLARAVKDVERRIGEAKEQITFAPVVADIRVAAGGRTVLTPAWHRWWDQASDEERRAKVAATIRRVVVLPAPHGRPAKQRWDRDLALTAIEWVE